jgi:hypothetical protein
LLTERVIPSRIFAPPIESDKSLTDKADINWVNSLVVPPAG